MSLEKGSRIRKTWTGGMLFVARLRARESYRAMKAARVADDARIVDLKRENARLREALTVESRRLDWVIAHSATIYHSNDGEFCSIRWNDVDGAEMFEDGRQAIDFALNQVEVRDE